MKALLLIPAAALMLSAQTRTVDLTWSSTVTPVTGQTITHVIERATVAAGADCATATGYAEIATVPVAARSYADTAAPIGNVCYRISTVATTASGLSARSTYAYRTGGVLFVPLPPPPPPTDLGAIIRELIAAITLEIDGVKVARTEVPVKVRAAE